MTKTSHLQFILHLLKILAALRNEGAVTKEQIAQDLQIDQRSVTRMFRVLRNLGAPLEWDRERRAYRLTNKKWRLDK